MASRRMVALSIINQSSFLFMSATARLLYFDLLARADDDGFVEAMVVLRITCADEEDLKDLEKNGYVKVLDQDSLLTWIPQWKVHNSIPKDRYHPSIYHDRLKTLEGTQGTQETQQRQLSSKRKRPFRPDCNNL